MIGFFVREYAGASGCFRFAALSAALFAALFAAHRSRARRSLAPRRLAIAPSAGYVSQSASLKHSLKRTRPYYVDVRKRGSRLPPFPLSAVPFVFVRPPLRLRCFPHCGLLFRTCRTLCSANCDPRKTDSAGRSRGPCGPRQTRLRGKRKAAPASHGDRSVKS